MTEQSYDLEQVIHRYDTISLKINRRSVQFQFLKFFFFEIVFQFQKG